MHLSASQSIFLIIFLLISSFGEEEAVGSCRSIPLGFRNMRNVKMSSSLHWEVNELPHVQSLRTGSWVKFISGASNEDIPLIRNLCAIYTAVGVDCIDLSANPAVVAAASEGIEAGMKMVKKLQQTPVKPLIMISVNDDEDPHFRKAFFDPTKCPSDCPRPCERICPARAIPSLSKDPNAVDYKNGVITARCYGCDRCVKVCPLGLINTTYYISDRNTIISLFQAGLVDALEIHTLQGHQQQFINLWNEIGNAVLTNAKVLAVSFPDMGKDTIAYLKDLQAAISNNKQWSEFRGIQIWQTDGRPMSGDIGKGTVHASAELASQILNHPCVLSTGQEGCEEIRGGDEMNGLDFRSGRHFVQLAGGTNNYSGQTAREQGISSLTGFGGFAFGGYARKKLNILLGELERQEPGACIENKEVLWNECLDFAEDLIQTVKGKTNINK